MIDLFVLLFSFTLLHLNLYFGEKLPLGVLKILFTLPIWIVTFRNLSVSQIFFFTKQNKLLFFFLFLVALANFRSLLSNVATFNELFFNFYLITTILFFAISLLNNKEISFEKLVLYFFGSIGLYIVINISMQFFGFQTSAKRVLEMYANPLDRAIMLEWLGVYFKRTLFPLANGLNNFATICGISLTFWSIILLKKDYNKTIKCMAVIFIICSFLGISMTDSRGPVIFSLVSILLVIFLRNKKYLAYSIFIIPLLLPLLFFFIYPIVDLLSNLKFNFIFDISRSNSADILNFAGRSIVWQSAFDKLSLFSFTHLIGYGWFGQTISGIVGDFYKLASMFVNPERLSLHNSYLQYIFNIGYTGLLIFLILYYRAFRRLLYDKYAIYPALSSAITAPLFFMSVNALFEVNLALVGDESIFFVIFIFVLLSKSKEDNKLNCVTSN